MPQDIVVEFHDYYIARSVLDLFIYWLRTAPLTEVRATLRWPVDIDGLALDLCRQHQRMLGLTDQEDEADEELADSDRADVRAQSEENEPIRPVVVAEPANSEATCCAA